VELEATQVQLGVRLTNRSYTPLGLVDFPRPDPIKGLAPHLVLLDDGRGVNLGRIARITTGRPFSPAPADGRVAVTDPATYHAWYETPHGAWIAGRELVLLDDLLRPKPGESVLDVGCGTGYFAGALAARGEDLPFADGAFDYALAVTSLCFAGDPAQALGELWRVSRRAVALGLLHRRSLLYLSKAGRGGYRRARWDLLGEVLGWIEGLAPPPEPLARFALFLPGGGPIARRAESLIPPRLPLGGFLAVCLRDPDPSRARPRPALLGPTPPSPQET
jgi:SAM-dependent methyltransferase